VAAHRVYGSEQKMLRIIKGLKERGHKVYCVTQGWSDGKFNELLDQEQIPYISLKLGFLYVSKPLWTLDTIVHYPGALLKIKKLIRQFKPDVIYHNSYKTLFMLSPIMNKEKVLFHVGDLHPETDVNKKIFKVIDNSTKSYIAISKSVKNNLISLGIKKDIEVIYNGVEELSVEKESSPNVRTTVGVVGQIIKRKGQEDVIRAAASLKKDFPDLKIKLYGEGNQEYKMFLEALAIEKGVADCMQFMGYEGNKLAMYQSLDCVVVSSRSEALGNVAIEPMFAKIPVISSNVGGLSEIVKHELTGLLYVPGDHIGLASQLTRLLTDTALYNRLVHQAARYAEETFSIQVMLDHIEATLEQYE
jgi:glycosyltransferase involved in cell wall biosynthesis